MAIEKVVNIKVSDNIDATTQHVGSLKSELRKAQQEVAELSNKFGATSKQAVEAAKRAAELKDRIGDAKNLTDAFNPDAKFKALSASLSGVASGFAAYQGALGLAGAESKDLEKQLLKVQSAMAVAQGLQGLGEAKDSFIQLKAVAVNAFQSIKTAIGSTGIGLLVIALGTLYTYWDNIKETVSGVNDEQKQQNVLLNEGAKKSKEQLSSLNAQDETLKRSGKTEREILSIKEKQTQEAINQQIKAIENNIQLRKIQEETSARNKEILKGILDFIASPIVGILAGIDLIGKQFGKTFGLADKFKDFTANLVFDPAKVKAEGEAAAKEDQKVLQELINQRDGYHNQINAIDTTARKKREDDEKERLKEAEAEAKRLYDINQEYLKKQNDAELSALDLVDKIKKENEDSLLTDAERKRKAEEEDYLKKQATIQNDLIDEDTKKRALEELEINHLNKINDINLEAQKVQYDAEAKTLEDKRILKEQELALTEQTFGKIADLAGRNSKIGKAFALGQAIINTYQGITAELQTKAVTPYEIGLKIANVALVAATGFKAVKSILATNPMSPSVSGGGGGVGGSGGAVTAPSFNIVGQNSNNQLAQSIANKQSQPVEAYVVSGKVSSAQSLDRNRIDTATFN